MKRSCDPTRRQAYAITTSLLQKAGSVMVLNPKMHLEFQIGTLLPFLLLLVPLQVELYSSVLNANLISNHFKRRFQLTILWS